LSIVFETKVNDLSDLWPSNIPISEPGLGFFARVLFLYFDGKTTDALPDAFFSTLGVFELLSSLLPDAFFSTLGVFETRRLVDGGED
jgi:hypothetical protein